MRDTLKILWSGLVNAYDAALTIVVSNIYFALLCIPVITIPLGFAGLYYTNFQLASGESTDWKTFFEGVQRYWWAGIRWTVINVLVLFSLVFYFFLFIGRNELWASALLGLDLGIMAIWVILMFLTFPMMLKQEKPGFLNSLRNVAVFLLRWPGFSFTFLITMIFLVVISIYFPPLFIFLSIGLVAFLGCYAVYYRIESEQHPELFKDPRHD